MKIAVYSIVRGRPELTEQSFQSLRDRAGVDYDHLIHDNTEYNVGLQVASNMMLDDMRREGYDYIVRFDNDIMVESDNILRELVAVCKAMNNRATLSPHVKGLIHQPERFGNTTIAGHKLGFVEIIGGTLRLTPTDTLKGFSWDVRHPMGVGETAYVCKWLKKQVPINPMAYVEDLFVTHGESTDKQMKDDPVYFNEHACLQRYPYVPPLCG
jgi:hypothetical protein